MFLSLLLSLNITLMHLAQSWDNFVSCYMHGHPLNSLNCVEVVIRFVTGQVLSFVSGD